MNPKRLLSASIIAAAITPICEASDFRFGVSLGYGGAGLSQTVVSGSTSQTVQRSESPGVFTLAVDYLLGDFYSIAFEHSRGFRMGPLSSGVAFTGFVGRWYFWSPAPSVPKAPAKGVQGTTLFVKRFSPFIGAAAGAAVAEVNRDNDVVPTVSSSGIYFGYKMGADYPLFPGFVLRPEVGYSTTLQSPGTVNQFYVQCGGYFFL